MTAVGRAEAFGRGHSGESLSALLDGELDQREAEAVGRHLAGCFECRQELTRLADARQQLRAMTMVPAPAGLAARTRARIGWQRRAVTVAAVLVSGLAGLVLWAARPEAEVTALPAVAPDLATTTVTMALAPAAPAQAAAANHASANPAHATPGRGAALDLGAIQPLALSSLPAGYMAPSVLDGMALAGIWRSQGVLAAVYGQGTSRLLVLEQGGRLVASAGQHWEVVGARRGEMGSWGTEATFANQVGPDLVVTAVGSAQDVAEVADSMATWRVNPPWLYRARTVARRLVEELTGS